MTVREAESHAVDDVAGVAQRFRRFHDTIDAAEIRRAEDFLGRHVGDELLVLRVHAAGAFPDVILRHTDSQIGSVRRSVMQSVELLGVQNIGFRQQACFMRIPGSHRIGFIDAASLEDFVPQSVDLFLFRRQIREDFCCPFRAGSGSDGPADFVGLGRDALRIEGDVIGFLDSSQLLAVDAVQRIRIGRAYRKAARFLFNHVEAFINLVLRNVRHALLRRVQVGFAGDEIVGPLDDDFLGAQRVGFLRQQTRERCLLDVDGDDDRVAFLHIDPFRNQQFGVLLQIFLKIR